MNKSLTLAFVLSLVTGNAWAADALLIRDALPWGSSLAKDTELAVQLGPNNYDVIASNQIGSTNLGQYGFIIINDDQPQSFYDNLFSGPGGTLHQDLVRYVELGGVVSLELCDSGWNMGYWAVYGYTLPGGIGGSQAYSDDNSILDPAHPIVTGIYGGVNGGQIFDAGPGTDLDGWNYSSHGFFTNTANVAGLISILGDPTNGNAPVFIDYPWGAGRIVASYTTTEWRYDAGNTKLLANDIGYQHYIPEPASLGVLLLAAPLAARRRLV